MQVTQKDKSDQPAPIYTGDAGDGQVEGVQGQTTEGQTTHIINSESLVTDGTGVSGPQKITIIQQAGWFSYFPCSSMRIPINKTGFKSSSDTKMVKFSTIDVLFLKTSMVTFRYISLTFCLC